MTKMTMNSSYDDIINGLMYMLGDANAFRTTEPSKEESDLRNWLDETMKQYNEDTLEMWQKDKMLRLVMDYLHLFQPYDLQALPDEEVLIVSDLREKVEKLQQQLANKEIKQSIAKKKALRMINKYNHYLKKEKLIKMTRDTSSDDTTGLEEINKLSKEIREETEKFKALKY